MRRSLVLATLHNCAHNIVRLGRTRRRAPQPADQPLPMSKGASCSSAWQRKASTFCILRDCRVALAVRKWLLVGQLNIPVNTTMEWNSFIHLTHIRNYGRIFGLLQGQGWVFAALSLALLGGIVSGCSWEPAYRDSNSAVSASSRRRLSNVVDRTSTAA